MLSTYTLRQTINSFYRADEEAVIKRLLTECRWSADIHVRIAQQARDLIGAVRQNKRSLTTIDRLMGRYDLGSSQGIALMSLAEALLRIPDTATAEQFMRDKLDPSQWDPSKKAERWFDHAADAAVRLSHALLQMSMKGEDTWRGRAQHLASKAASPLIRQGVQRGIMMLANQFILGSTLEEAQKSARPYEERGYRFSYDMLGEAALTAEDAERYFQAYQQAINSLARTAQGKGLVERAGISVKLSALHPRFEYTQQERVVREISLKVLHLALKCKESNIGLTIDAEEADRLDLTLDVFEAVAREPKLDGWDGLGLAVQAYQKRARAVIDWMEHLARQHSRRLTVRLVKGAYWDTEIKRAQERGLDNYPVFTLKASTDVSYLACAQRLLGLRDVLYPQFATHNAYTVATILELADSQEGYEFQRLQGMGEALYAQIIGPSKLNIPCRIYAPVGHYNDLLPYLVRRLLENGANTSFVHHLADPKIPLEHLLKDPIKECQERKDHTHPKIALPVNLYGERRKNSLAPDLSDREQCLRMLNDLEQEQTWISGPIVGGRILSGEMRNVVSPFDGNKVVGQVTIATPAHVAQAYALAHQIHSEWAVTPVDERASCLEKAADMMEQALPELVALCVKEAGKTIEDAIAEVREAVDFCRYYAEQARQKLMVPLVLPGPTGERNTLSLHGRGVFACISPWNFPLAIFMGQVTAALVAGNCVLAKPSEHTPLMAAYAVRILHQAGIPYEALHLLPGPSQQIGGALLEHPYLAGVAMTGSLETAQAINKVLARRSGPLVPLIAETGGQNAMIVDSSALSEQVVQDVITSSFRSAGQRCSALRLLFIQEDIAPRCLSMLAGAMAELVVGNPMQLATDVGPVISKEIKLKLAHHAAAMQKIGRLIYQTPLREGKSHGHYVAPVAFELSDVSHLQGEHFGPILHIMRYRSDDLDRVLEQVNALGYGLTVGIHSRIDSTIQHIHRRLRVGNTYVNRSIIGAVVGTQPFGGEGLSGTGPKAGGPHYLYRFMTERTLSINTTAQGGNATLMMLGE